MSKESHFDAEAIARIHRLGGDDLVGRMIGIFSENVPKRLAAAAEGLAAGDLQAIEQAVHSIKSSAGNLGAIRFQQLAADIEERAEQGLNARLDTLLDELNAAFTEALDHLQDRP